MARNVRTARGEIIDFDALVLKQRIAEAPMNIEVARRKQFIDNKEGKVRGSRTVANPMPEVEDVVEVEASIAAPVEVEQSSAPSALDFEVEDAPLPKRK